MLKRLLARNKRSIFILLYFGIMPSIMGSIVSGIVIHNVIEIRNFDLILLIGFNLVSSIVLAIGFIPTTVYSLLLGYILGWTALPLVLLSYTIACAIGYILCNWLDNGKMVEFFQEKYDIISFKQKLENTGFWIAALCRLSPALPFAVLNAVFAIVRFPFGKYMFGSMVGMIPRTVFAVFVGRSFINITSIDDLKSDYTLWIAISLAIVSFIGIGWIVKRIFG
ncbi:MAG: VTT domain-containing protein [Opitutaceae bacterium]|nr:VTT domain-containing protein [Cytophagales bacterium]